MKKIKKVVAAVKKVGTLNLVLILVGAFFVWFNWQMILVFRDMEVCRKPMPALLWQQQ